MASIKLGILFGGTSSEREVSMGSGFEVARYLDPQKYETRLIEITKSGQFVVYEKINNQKTHTDITALKSEATIDLQQGVIESTLRMFDVIFIALHGSFGEDGRVQAFLDIVGVPYTGSNLLASALSFDKIKTMELCSLHEITIPGYLIVDAHTQIEELGKIVGESFGFPCVVKPNTSGSSIGVSLAKNKTELTKSVQVALAESDKVIVQQYIKGREVTCGSIGNSGSDTLESLPVVEVKTHRDFFDYTAKYHDETTRIICPAEVDYGISKHIQSTAQEVHELIGCDGLTRSDFILDENNRLYFLEINTSPGLMKTSLIPQEALVAGYTYGEFLDRIITLALDKKKVTSLA